MSTPANQKIYEQVKKKYMKNILNILLIVVGYQFENTNDVVVLIKVKKTNRQGLIDGSRKIGKINVVKQGIKVNQMFIDQLLRLIKIHLLRLKS